MGVGNVKNIAERMRDANVNRAILVSQTTLTPFARQCIAELASKYLIESVRLLRPRKSATVEYRAVVLTRIWSDPAIACSFWSRSC